MKSLEEARATLEKYWRPRRRKLEVPLEGASGRVLAEDVISTVDVPPFDRSLFDGYAVRAADTFGAGEESLIELSRAGGVRPGEWPRLRIGGGQCAEIATGAPVPKGSDAVVMLEFATAEGGTVRIFRAVAPGENIERRGSEIKRGTKVLKAGKVTTPQVLGTLAAIGKKRVRVFSPPKVAVISSGMELVRVGSPLKPGKIYDVNTPTICQAIELCKGEAVSLGIADDDPKSIETLTEKGLSIADVVVLSGGSSVGAGDIVPSVIDRMGGPGVIVHGLAVKPGKPTFLAIVRGKPVFGLPGFPVSALMIFDQLVAPYLRFLSGLPPAERVKVRARLASKVISAMGRRELVPVRLFREDGEFLAKPILKSSGAITSLSMADGYIDVPLEQEIVEGGETVEVILFGVEALG